MFKEWMAAGLCIAAAAGASSSVARSETERLKSQWMALNEECRGGSHEAGDAVCRSRDAVEAHLNRIGQCWAYSDWRVLPTKYDWHPCSQSRPRKR